MMKSTIIYLSTFVLSASIAYAADNPIERHASQEPSTSGEGPATVSIRQTDESLCDTPLWVNFYDITVAAFAHGAGQVSIPEFEQKVFAWVRASEEFSDGGAEAFVEHIKGIPRQLVEIIREDPAVLDSCSNFSVALIGPP
jgi:hypothetical protein